MLEHSKDHFCSGHLFQGSMYDIQVACIIRGSPRSLRKTVAGASEASERAAQSMSNSGLAFRIRQRRHYKSILEASLKYGTDVSYSEQTNNMLNQTPTAFYEPMKHKPIHSLKHKATGYRGIKTTHKDRQNILLLQSRHIFVANRFPQWQLKFSAKVW